MVADALTNAGLEIEAVISRSIPRDIVAAKITDVSDHPDADKLRICSVVSSPTGEVLQVVCGAPNVRTGMIAPFAPVGSVLPGDLKIKKAKLRGVESYGMLLSERECNISDEHSGLLELSQDLLPGTPLHTIYADDTLFDLSITPDRGDCLSIKGVAREIAALLGCARKTPAYAPYETSAKQSADFIQLTVEAPEFCPRYLGRIIESVTVSESPLWLQHKLRAAGLRPINNIVDITNYVLLTYGQPMHAFDYATLSEKNIRVAAAAKGERFTALDEKSYSLKDNDHLIYDGQTPVALGGVIGGLHSGITDQTSCVFLECAYFNPVEVRTTARSINISTDSSYRFERGVDPQSGLEEALEAATALIAEIAGGTVAKNRVEFLAKPLQNKNITLREAQIPRVLGVKLSSEQICSLLNAIDIQTSPQPNECIDCSVPLFRHDIEGEIDLIEEVGRLYGYENIPTPHYFNVPVQAKALSIHEQIYQQVRAICSGFGLSEIYCTSFISKKAHRDLNAKQAPVALLNPLSEETALMRTTLLAGHLAVTRHNLNHKSGPIAFFEIGPRFYKENETFCETIVAAITMGSTFAQGALDQSALAASAPLVKSILEKFAAILSHDKLTITPTESLSPQYDYFAPQTAATFHSGAVSGVCGVVKNDIVAKEEIKTEQIFHVEIDLQPLLTQQPAMRTYAPMPKFPAVVRSFNFLLPQSTSSAVIIDYIHQFSSDVEAVRVVDMYQGDKIPAGMKSVSFEVSLRLKTGTISEKDARSFCDKLIASVRSHLGIELRTE